MRWRFIATEEQQSPVGARIHDNVRADSLGSSPSSGLIWMPQLPKLATGIEISSGYFDAQNELWAEDRFIDNFEPVSVAHGCSSPAVKMRLKMHPNQAIAADI
ncbi:unnamed protein product [Protopolystoma xenopodis]|uniref:Uncharacterized protein n=1 Tax=Protopolystoma xenopodis TaxID=117903 RepID=A0A3S5BU25_9PLAT|nr:unnamed protein product [Protopolystoma xenopodis]